MADKSLSGVQEGDAFSRCLSQRNWQRGTDGEKPWQRPTFVGAYSVIYFYTHTAVVLPPQLTGQTIHSAKKTQRILLRSEICSPRLRFFKKKKSTKCRKNQHHPPRHSGLTRGAQLTAQVSLIKTKW